MVKREETNKQGMRSFTQQIENKEEKQIAHVHM